MHLSAMMKTCDCYDVDAYVFRQNENVFMCQYCVKKLYVSDSAIVPGEMIVIGDRTPIWTDPPRRATRCRKTKCKELCIVLAINDKWLLCLTQRSVGYVYNDHYVDSSSSL